ncbi:hypothetical protein ACHHYP_14419 [Achlya hypogyna]|uniref:Vacuolar protein 8 n=1 Tax=Achlya hypogyna TaxID=1202772 RepID=A0A1V9YD76_ACHHY|nr:hypothetical protein ACHHYP_14419 [Achlya hypogyna]
MLPQGPVSHGARSRNSTDATASAGLLLSPKPSTVGSRASLPALAKEPALGSLKARKKMIRSQPQAPGRPPSAGGFDGVIYQSRIKAPLAYETSSVKERWLIAAVRSVHSADALLNNNGSISSAGKVYQHLHNAEGRARCAESLYKLSKQPHSELMIIRSGAIQNIADLSDVDDTRLALYCAATLANLTSTADEETLASFIENKGIPGVLEISWSPSYDVKCLCALTLCRLSTMAPFAKFLHTSKAVIELSSMLSLPYAPLQQLCVQTLINMIAHGCDFPEKLFAGGGSNAHTNIGVILALSQLAQDPAHGIFAAEAIYNMSLQPSSASGAVRGGVGELLYTLIHAPHVHLQNRSRLQTVQNIKDVVLHDEQIAISQLLAPALGHLSKYIDLHMLLGAWSLKAIAFLLSLYDSMRSTHADTFAFILAPASRVLANLSANDEYVKAVLADNEALVRRAVDLARWSPSPECVHNGMRSLANLTRNAHCTRVLVAANVVAVLNAALLLPPTTDHLPSMKEDALVALVNIACYQQMPESCFTLEVDSSLAFAFHAHKAASPAFAWSVSKTMCYWTFDSRLRTVLLGDVEFLMEALLFGFHYAPPATDAGVDPFHAVKPRIAGPLDAYDDVANGVESQLRFLAAMCYCASEIRAIPHVHALVKVILTSMDTAATHGAVEYYCAGILFALSRTLLWLFHNDDGAVEAEWAAVLFAEPIQQAILRLSRSALQTPTQSTYAIGTQAFCTSTLYHICASEHTSAQALAVLVEACNVSEDPATLMACASTFAIVSFTAAGRDLLLTTQGLAHALNKLGRASVCQQNAAIAACNVAIAGCIWNAEELKDFVVVALLRSNSSDAIQVHAKTLYNLLSHPTSRNQVINEGVLYSFLKLAQLQTNGLHGLEETLSLCLHALFNLSENPAHHDTLLKLGVTPFLFTGVSGRRKRMLHFLNIDSRRYAVGLLCNLSARDANHKELIQNAQVVDILRALCDGDIETRASAAMTLRNLTLHLPNAEVMCTRNSLSLLLVFMTSANDTVRRLAAQALGNCSLVTELVHVFQQLNVADALLHVLESHVLEVETASAILKTLHNLAIDDTLAVHLLQTKIVARWHGLSATFWAPAELSHVAAATCRVLSQNPECAGLVSAQRAVELCLRLCAGPAPTIELVHDCISCLVHLSTHCGSHAVLFDQQVVASVAQLLTIARPLPATEAAYADLYLCATVLVRNMSLSTTQADVTLLHHHHGSSHHLHHHGHHPPTPAAENPNASSQLMTGLGWLTTLLGGFSSDDERYPRMCSEVAVALANLTKIKRLRQGMLDMGVLQVLLDIHGRFAQNPAYGFIQQSCTVTLHRLAAEDAATMEPGLIEALLSGLNHTDTLVHESQREEGKVSSLASAVPEFLTTSRGLCQQSYRDVRWFNYVVQAPNAGDITWDLTAEAMRMNRIRGPLPALQDVKDGVIAGAPECSSDRDICHILRVDIEKKDVETGASVLPHVGGEEPRHGPSKLFDRHMKTSRRNSRQNILMITSLPHLDRDGP